MNRREFLKSMVIMAGAACLGFVRPAPRWVRLTVTDPRGRVTRTTRPVYFVNRRLQRPLARFLEGRWA